MNQRFFFGKCTHGALGLLVLGASLSCSPSSDGTAEDSKEETPAPVTAEFHIDRAIDNRLPVFLDATTQPDSGEPGRIYVLGSELPNVCSTQRPLKAGAAMFQIGIAKTGGVTAGTYRVGSVDSGAGITPDTEGSASLIYYEFGEFCLEGAFAFIVGSASGTLTLETVDLQPGGGLRGSFDVVMLGDAEHTTGTFGAPFCDVTPQDSKSCNVP